MRTRWACTPEADLRKAVKPSFHSGYGGEGLGRSLSDSHRLDPQLNGGGAGGGYYGSGGGGTDLNGIGSNGVNSNTSATDGTGGSGGSIGEPDSTMNGGAYSGGAG